MCCDCFAECDPKKLCIYMLSESIITGESMIMRLRKQFAIGILKSVIDWPRRAGFPARQDSIRVRILKPSIRAGSEFWYRVFEPDHGVGIEY